jgi:16S rRNA (guanine527-N7)-methyltransferase
MALDVAIPGEARDKLDRYLDLLAKWNRTYNLTAIRERTQMVTHHVHDALAVLPFLPHGAARLLDVGTGGGVPGIPLAIARPDLRITLLDASHKKVSFLTQAVIELGLSNVTPVASRVEAYAADPPFEVVISRAFSDLASFTRLTAPLVAPHGQWIAMKGALPLGEIAALPRTVCVIATPALQVPGLAAERHLVIMQPVVDMQAAVSPP